MILFFVGHDETLQISDHLSAYSRQKKHSSDAYRQVKPTSNDGSGETTSKVNTKAAYTSIPSRQTQISFKEPPSDDNVSEVPSANEPTTPEISSNSVEFPDSPSKLGNQQRQPLDDEPDSRRDQLFAGLPYKTDKDKGWAAGISVNPGMLSFNSMNAADIKDKFPSSDASIGANHPSSSETDEDKNESPTPTKMPRSMQGIENYLEFASRRHHLPLSFALSAEKRLSSWLGLESGIGYSYLHSDFERLSLTGSDISTCH